MPWKKVGEGWFLVIDNETETLWLIDSAANRYRIISGRALTDGGELLDWAPDGRYALLRAFDGSQESLLEIDLKSGAIRRAIVPNLQDAVYTRPTGANVVVRTPVLNGDDIVAEKVSRGVFAPDATRFVVKKSLLTGADVVDGLVYAPDGKRLYVGNGSNVLALDNAGRARPTVLSVAAGAFECAPTSWWAPGVLLVRCGAPAGLGIWAVPVDGAAPTELAIGSDDQSGDSSKGAGYVDAMRVGTMTLLAHSLACGDDDIYRRVAAGSATKLQIAGSPWAEQMIGPAGGRVAVLASASCSGPSWFGFIDPVTGSTSIAVSAVPSGGEDPPGALSAIAFGR